jgi:hypothetical protein
LDKEERQFYGTLRRELNTLRRLAAVQGDRDALREAMEEAGNRADAIANEARFLQLDNLADLAERLARHARSTRNQEGIGSFLETLFSFHEHLPEASGLREAATAAVEDAPGGRSGSRRRHGAAVDAGEPLPGSVVEVNFNTPPQELFELDLLERKLVIEALDRGEGIYSLTARARGGGSGVLQEVLYHLEESVHVIRALIPGRGGRSGRIDILYASTMSREDLAKILAEADLQEARIERVSSERLALSVERPDLRVTRGLLAGLSEIELRLEGEEYERYVLLKDKVQEELESLLNENLPPQVSQRVERVRRLTAASAGDIAHRSNWRALEIAYRLALWLEEEGVLSEPLRLSVEGGDQEYLESSVAQLTERAVRSAAVALLETAGVVDSGSTSQEATPELLFEVVGKESSLTLWLTQLSPAIVAEEPLQARLEESEASYVVRDLLSGRVSVAERRGSEGISITVPRGGHTVTVVIADTLAGEIAFPAALIVEVQPLFSRLVAQSADGRVFMRFRGSNIPLYTAAGYPVAANSIPSEGSGLVLRIGQRQVAVHVDQLVSEESVLLGAEEQVFVESLGRRLPVFFPLELF